MAELEALQKDQTNTPRPSKKLQNKTVKRTYEIQARIEHLPRKAAVIEKVALEKAASEVSTL